MRAAIGLAALLAALASCATPAGPPDRPCGDSAAIYGRLAERYGEQRRIFGRTATGQALEIWSSAGGATWTVLLTGRDGRSCVLEAGESLILIVRRERT